MQLYCLLLFFFLLAKTMCVTHQNTKNLFYSRYKTVSCKEQPSFRQQKKQRITTIQLHTKQGDTNLIMLDFMLLFKNLYFLLLFIFCIVQIFFFYKNCPFTFKYSFKKIQNHCVVIFWHFMRYFLKNIKSRVLDCASVRA